MQRDIDRIIARLKDEFPSLLVQQLKKTHPADDDGLWWVKLSECEEEIQIESPSGNVPFLIEADSIVKKNASEEEVIAFIKEFRFGNPHHKE
ncbi:hypothetical protein [Pedosphaera parvula]|uniref:hypothetical protein n=1 Tax=Pedosphaera parvula TaxID=1032527 RepID=UPI001ED8D773|nr:hypothetical protein [Pedosphaera parvula]